MHNKKAACSQKNRIHIKKKKGKREKHPCSNIKMKTAIAREGGSGVRSCELKATRLWSGNFPGGNQRESRNHLCVQSSPLQRNYPVQTPTFLGAEPPWPSPRSTCCKASQFAAHFVLDIKKWSALELQRITHTDISMNSNEKQNGPTNIQVTLLLNFRGNRTFLGLMFRGKNKDFSDLHHFHSACTKSL